MDPASQAAEMAVAKYLNHVGVTPGLTALVTEDPAVRNTPPTGEKSSEEPDQAARTVTDTGSGRVFHVELEHRDSVMVVSSCGDKPKQSKSWVVVEIQEA